MCICTYIRAARLTGPTGVNLELVLTGQVGLLQAHALGLHFGGVRVELGQRYHVLLLLALLPLGDGLDDDGRLLLGPLLGELVTCSEREGAGEVRSGQVRSGR